MKTRKLTPKILELIRILILELKKEYPETWMYSGKDVNEAYIEESIRQQGYFE